MKATIRGKHYTIPHLNVGQLEQLAEILDGPAKGQNFAVFRLVTERAEPPITDEAEPTVQEMNSIIDGMMQDCGLRTADSKNEEAPGAGA